MNPVSPTHLQEHNLPDSILFYITDWILLYSSLRKKYWGFLHKIATLSSKSTTSPAQRASNQLLKPSFINMAGKPSITSHLETTASCLPSTASVEARQMVIKRNPKEKESIQEPDENWKSFTSSEIW